MPKYTLGVDLADRAARAVVVDGNGAVVRRAQGPGADMLRVVKEVAGPDIDGFGVSVAEGIAFDPRRHGPKGIPPVVTAPGSAAVAAEHWIGAARGTAHVICLSIGDSVVAGILLDGEPWKGAHGRAGAAAWLALNPVERQDYRKYGSLAAEVSSHGIARRLSWRIQAGDESSALEDAGGLESITAAHVFDAARAGDGVAISVVRETAKYIGMAAANLAVAIDPDVIVLSGLVASAGDLLLEPVRQECARRLPPDLAGQAKIEISPLGEDGIAIGAARLARRSGA